VISAITVTTLATLAIEFVSATDTFLHDYSLKAEVVAEGLRLPTTMAFLGPDDILVLEKNDGTVKRILNGTVLSNPVLDVSVANSFERGMLGIDLLNNRPTYQENQSRSSNSTYFFLYYTETDVEGGDVCPKPSYCVPSNASVSNRVYRYEWDNSTGKLVNPILLIDLPANPGPLHNGGKLIVSPDNNIYFTIGDLLYQRSATQNFPNTTAYNGSSGIYRITQEGKPVSPVLGSGSPLDKYYAYGIRNSFGIDFDPVTGNLWDTENGPAFGDEINLVEPGFNSGWTKVQGLWSIRDLKNGEGAGTKVGTNPNNLEDFGGKGKYSSPEFIWFNKTGPTAIKFLNSEALGKRYQNNLFVGDFHQGNIYYFKLNENRTGFVLEGALSDKIARFVEELDGIKFGEGFGGITDLQVGPHDGYLYVVSYGQGKIYRILPAN
jgi:glucose/arabinose dehydrogenase